jgi:hypothetical protein
VQCGLRIPRSGSGVVCATPNGQVIYCGEVSPVHWVGGWCPTWWGACVRPGRVRPVLLRVGSVSAGCCGCDRGGGGGPGLLRRAWLYVSHNGAPQLPGGLAGRLDGAARPRDDLRDSACA